MPTYPIVVSVDPSNAESGVSVVEDKLASATTKATGLQTAMQRAFDFNTGPAAQNLGVVEKAIEAVENETDKASTKVRGLADSIGLLIAPSKNAADSMNLINQRLSQLYPGIVKAQEGLKGYVNSTAQVRQGNIILGEQFRQFSTQVLGGGSVVQAFAQQAGQAAFALQFFNGSLGSVGAFLAGPWGTIVIIATTVLAGLADELFNNKKKAEEAEEALKKYGNRQLDIANFIDITTGALKEQNRTLVQNAILLRQAAIAKNEKDSSESRSKAIDLATGFRIDPNQSIGVGTAGGSIFTAATPDKDVQKALKDANGDIAKLADSLYKLSKNRPELRGLATDVSTIGGQAILSARDTERLNREIKALSGDPNALYKGTSAGVQRDVRLATARTPTEKAQANLSLITARGSAIDNMTPGKARDEALVQYRKDLTDATNALYNARDAQKAAAAGAREHAKELREAAAAAKKAREEAQRETDFISRLKDQGDVNAQRGVQGQIQAQIDNFKRQFHRDPSEGPGGQREQIENAVRRNQLLADEKTILDSILTPGEEYNRRLAAANDLLEKGKINQIEFNAAMEASPLFKALQTVDDSLTGTIIQYDAQIKKINDSITAAIKTIDDAEKAGILGKAEAQARRVALRGPDDPNGDVVVNGTPQDDLRSRQLRTLDRSRRQPLNALDHSLGGSYERKAKLQEIKDEEADRMQVLRDARAAELVDDQGFQSRKTEIEKLAADERKKLADAETETRLAAAQTAADALLGVAEAYAGKQSAIYKGIFLVSKAFAIAQAILAIQQNVAEASKYGFPQNIPFIAAAIAQGASILTNIMQISAQFRTGGYTGEYGESEVAGVVHGREFVVNAAATRENRALLEAINSGQVTRSSRAASNDNTRGGGRSVQVNINASQAPGVEFEASHVSDDRIEIIARRVVARETPGIMASELSRPNSRPSKALGAKTTVRRKRA